MKILFICKANVGRSQIAEALLNNLTDKHIAVSAGLNPPKKWEGEKLSKTEFVADCMKQIDINVDNQISKRIRRSMVEEADIVIVMGEKTGWPEYLKNSDKARYWDIVDPDGNDMKFYQYTRNKIEKNIKELLQGLEE